jgi:hypothetical protein
MIKQCAPAKEIPSDFMSTAAILEEEETMLGWTKIKAEKMPSYICSI